jgi:hypothetical protein
MRSREELNGMSDRQYPSLEARRRRSISLLTVHPKT